MYEVKKLILGAGGVALGLWATKWVGDRIGAHRKTGPLPKWTTAAGWATFLGVAFLFYCLGAFFIL